MINSKYFEENFKEGCSIFRNSWLLDTKVKYEFDLLCTISYLCKGGVCTATNKWFADTLKSTPNTISQKLGKLHKAGYIEIMYKKTREKNSERLIKLLK